MYAIIITYNVTASGLTKAVRENPAVPEQVLFSIFIIIVLYICHIDKTHACMDDNNIILI